MSLFTLDTAGDQNLLNQPFYNRAKAKITKSGLRLDEERPKSLLLQATSQNDAEDSEDGGDYFGLPPPNVDISNIIETTLATTAKPLKRHTKKGEDLDHINELVDSAVEKAQERGPIKRRRVTILDYSDFNELTGKLDDEKLLQTDVAKVMEKSKMVPGLEQLKAQPYYKYRKQAKLNRIARSKTKGAGWFNLPATEKTEEVTNELKIIQMRSILNPKHFYKKNDLKVLPKYFQLGTVQHSPLDYYSERNTRKTKKSLVDELLADAATLKYTKRKFEENKLRQTKYKHRKAMKKMKKLKKNK